MSADVEHLPDPARQAEELVGTAVERLREDMPRAFILVYETGEAEKSELHIITHCNLNSARQLLEFAMDQISNQYAVTIARASTEKTK
jgi:hypothetical protein